MSVVVHNNDNKINISNFSIFVIICIYAPIKISGINKAMPAAQPDFAYTISKYTIPKQAMTQCKI